MGSVPRKLLQYAVPLVIMNLMQSLYSMADLLISGHFIGGRGISGINNSSQIMLLLTQILIGLSQGGNILIGQFFGAKNTERMKETVNTLFFSFMVLAIGLFAGLFLFSGKLLTLLGAPAYEEALIYLRVCSPGLLFIAGYNALVAAVRGVGDSRRPMKIIILSTFTNIALDVLFVGGFGWGTGGAAAATVIAQGISFFLTLFHVLSHPDIFGISLFHPGFRIRTFRVILRLGIPCAIQQSIAGLSWLTVTKFINVYGVAASAGAGVSAKIKDFCQLFISAVSSATSTMVAQTLGAEKKGRALEILHSAHKITCLAALIIILVVEIIAPQLVSVFTSETEVAFWAVKNLRIEIIGQIFYALFLVYHAFAVGAGHTWFVMGSSFVNCILVRVILVILLSRYMGLQGIFLACMAAPASSVPLGMLYVKGGSWKKQIIYE